MNRFILPHMYLFFGILLFILAENVVYSGTLYAIAIMISIICVLVGLVWNIGLLLYRE
ncbi:hypothetical protein BN1080_01729 [Planococcus massiliensis]|uniref:Uncharacterized protein n=1 Tax=Planococcus massiliensis TaxID=1499687 RepID=A0A098EKA8_9BACL|nr:hypothetical protein BN1080_01729 [Planococcus massiliensis]